VVETAEPDRLLAVPLDVVAIVQRAWELLRDNVGLVAGAALLPVVPMIPLVAVLGGLGFMMQYESLQTVALVGFFVVYLLAIPVILVPYLGSVRIFVSLARGRPASLGMLVGEAGRLPAALVTAVLISVVTSVGALFCFLPGVVLGLCLQYTLYTLVDQRTGPIRSIVLTWNLTFPYLLPLLLLDLALGVAGVALSCVTCGLGSVVVAPFSLLAKAVAYHSLLGGEDRVGGPTR
jgi:uncharacterized membrane protein